MILILNGPNLNLLGRREPEIYGHTTLEELEELCQAWGAELGLGVVCRQSNFEGQLVEWIQQAADEGFRAIVLNPGAFTHYSLALLDAIRGQRLPVVEVHLSNLHAREEYRRQSNFEGQLVEWIQQAADEGFRAIVLNPGAFTHYSLALLDAIRGQRLPVVEVHLSNLHAREEYRRHSVTAMATKGIISGFGPMSYKMALVCLADLLEAQP